MAVVDNAAGITIDATGQHNNAKLLDGLPAAAGTGQATRWDEAITKDGAKAFTADQPMGSNKLTGLAAGSGAGHSVRYEQVPLLTGTQAFTGVQAGVAPTAPTHLATRSWVDQNMVVVWGATTAALPAYTVSGGSAAGSTLTANANAAFPTLDGYVALTANDPVKGLFLLQNGASAVDNGIYMLTAQGSGGAAWTAVRYPGMDTAATIAGSKVRVANGLQKRGAEYCYVAQAAITMGTTKIYYKRVDQRITPNEGIRFYDDLREVFIVTNSTSQTMSRYQAGTGAAITVATSGNSATLMGELTCAIGTVATNKVGFINSWIAATTQPDNGNTFTPTATTGFDIEARIQVPVLSTSSQEFAINYGLTKQLGNNQKTPADGICFIYDRTSGVSAVNWLCSLTNGGTGTPVDSGIVVNATQYYRLRITQDPGDPNVKFWIDGALVSTQSTNAPVGTVLAMLCVAFKSVGTSTVVVMKADFFSGEFDFPEMRAA